MDLLEIWLRAVRNPRQVGCRTATRVVSRFPRGCRSRSATRRGSLAETQGRRQAHTGIGKPYPSLLAHPRCCHEPTAPTEHRNHQDEPVGWMSAHTDARQPEQQTKMRACDPEGQRLAHAAPTFREPNAMADDLRIELGAKVGGKSLDQPCKEFRLHRNEQREHEADGQTHDRASSYSAHKHLLFAVCHFTPPKTSATVPQPWCRVGPVLGVTTVGDRATVAA